MQTITKEVKDRLIYQARHMRRNPTPAEDLLWKKLRKKQVGGLRFRRQHPIYPFIVDFYCPSTKLVVEVDGAVHLNQLEYDSDRENYLRCLGCQVIRFTNEEIEKDLNSVLANIYQVCFPTIKNKLP